MKLPLVFAVVFLVACLAVTAHFAFVWINRPPKPPPRGGCGLRDCPNPRPHSHVEDLIRRLKEK